MQRDSERKLIKKKKNLMRLLLNYTEINKNDFLKKMKVYDP